MANTEYSTTAKLPIDTIWDFVKEMDNWAHFVTGYQRHEKQSDTDSLWTLKGDVGVLARTLTFQVHVTEWNEPERISFTLRGLNEPMEGGGSFTLEPYEGETTPRSGAAKKNPLMRLLERIAGFFFRLIHGKVERDAPADGGPGPGMARMTFQLRLDPGGPMAPMINAMIQPLMLPTAEDLANKIMAHLESQRDRTPGRALARGG